MGRLLFFFLALDRHLVICLETAAEGDSGAQILQRTLRTRERPGVENEVSDSGSVPGRFGQTAHGNQVE